jgi:hypothetical protein
VHRCPLGEEQVVRIPPSVLGNGVLGILHAPVFDPLTQHVEHAPRVDLGRDPLGELLLRDGAVSVKLAQLFPRLGLGRPGERVLALKQYVFAGQNRESSSRTQLSGRHRRPASPGDP